MGGVRVVAHQRIVGPLHWSRLDSVWGCVEVWGGYGRGHWYHKPRGCKFHIISSKGNCLVVNSNNIQSAQIKLQKHMHHLIGRPTSTCRHLLLLQAPQL